MLTRDKKYDAGRITLARIHTLIIKKTVCAQKVVTRYCTTQKSIKFKFLGEAVYRLGATSGWCYGLLCNVYAKVCAKCH